jgi:alcohol dehydrogenase, propanol-preferring
MDMMRAAVLAGYCQPLQVIRVPVPVPGPDEILIRLQASGVCHTDVHVWNGEAKPTMQGGPVILGHEGAGEVAAIGAEVTGWALGDRAGVGWLHDTCGTCEPCRSGQESFCQTQRAHGFSVPGTFAEYVVAKAAFATSLPPGDAADLAPLMCAGLTAFGALDRGGLHHGETCAIFGCGGLGLYAVQLAARRGARVVAVDTDPAKRAAALRAGAAQVSAGGDQAAEFDAHVTINFAPTARTWPAMVAATRPLGRIVSAAIVPEPVALSQDWLCGKGVTVMGTSVGTRAQMAALMQVQADAPLTSAITAITLDQVTNALTALAEGRAQGRYCIRF